MTTTFTHWLFSLDAETRKRVLAAGARVSAAIRTEWDVFTEKTLYLPARHLAPSDFDHVLRATIGSEYLHAIRHGSTPHAAQEHAAAEMAALVTGFNREKGAWLRSPASESDFLASLHRMVVDAVEAPETELAKAA